MVQLCLFDEHTPAASSRVYLAVNSCWDFECGCSASLLTHESGSESRRGICFMQILIHHRSS